MSSVTQLTATWRLTKHLTQWVNMKRQLKTEPSSLLWVLYSVKGTKFNINKYNTISSLYLLCYLVERFYPQVCWWLF